MNQNLRPGLLCLSCVSDEILSILLDLQLADHSGLGKRAEFSGLITAHLVFSGLTTTSATVGEGLEQNFIAIFSIISSNWEESRPGGVAGWWGVTSHTWRVLAPILYMDPPLIASLTNSGGD